MALFLLCIVFAPVCFAAHPVTVGVSCDGPDGYCQKGGNITVKTIGGGGVTIPQWKSSSLRLYIGICDKYGEYADQCYGHSLQAAALSAETTNGSTQWGSIANLVDGTYSLPWTINSKSCVSVYIAEVGTYRFLSYGTTFEHPNFALCAGDAPPPVPNDYCYVTGGKNWDITFGNVERGDIPTTGGTEQTKALALTCLGIKAHDLSVKLSMTPTSWSTSQLATSNPDLGVQVTVAGAAVKLGESFTMKVTGSGGKTLGFSVLRNPKTKAMDIATGDFTASGTLVVSEQ
jgi:minor fimbrial subunit